MCIYLILPARFPPVNHDMSGAATVLSISWPLLLGGTGTVGQTVGCIHCGMVIQPFQQGTVVANRRTPNNGGMTIIYNCTHLTGHTYIYIHIYNIQLCIHIHGVVDMTCPTRYYTCEQEIVSLFFLPVSSEFSLAATFF